MIGAYRIERELGRGGFGIVYIGVDTRLGRRAAIKQLLPEMSNHKEIVERFFNEAKAAANINHPGIIEIYDVGWHTDGSAYFAMKLLDGESLHQRLKTTRFTIPLAATIARQVAGALVAAHARGIVHRDLKPDNIILVRDDEVSIGERAVILDFGIAKLGGTEGMSHTRSGQMMGTPKYMSPEQCRGAGEVDQRTDIYALGCILFEMLTGRVPFLAEGPGEIMGMHQFVEPPPVRALRPDCPAELGTLVNRLLAKKLEQRMQLIGELQTALQPFTVNATREQHVVMPMPTAAEVVAGYEPTVPPTSFAPRASEPRVTPPAMRPSTPGQVVVPPRGPDEATVVPPPGIVVDLQAPGVPAPANPNAARSYIQSSPIRIPGPEAQHATLRATPPPPSKRGLMIAIGLIAVAGIATAVILTQRKGSTTVVTSDAAPAPDTATVVRRNDPARRDQLIGQCEQLAADKKWTDLGACGRELDELDPTAAKPYLRLARDAGAPPANPPTGPTEPPVEPLASGCDEAETAALEAKGEGQLGRSEFSAAFDSLDAAFKCKPAVLPLAYTAACRSRKFERAKELFAKFPAAKREEMKRICMKDGLDPTK